MLAGKRVKYFDEVHQMPDTEYVNPFHATDLFLYLLKTSENQRFSDIFKEWRRRPVTPNVLKHHQNMGLFKLP